MDQVQYQVANEQLGCPRLFVKVLSVEHQWKPMTYPLDHKALTIVERPETGPYYYVSLLGIGPVRDVPYMILMTCLLRRYDLGMVHCSGAYLCS